MLRFYSLLSPKGVPDQAALAAAQPAAHEWDGSGKVARLRVLGIESMEAVFYFTEEKLFIHQPRKIVFVDAPPKAISWFLFEPWGSEERGPYAVWQVERPQGDVAAWTSASGDAVNLLEKDKKEIKNLRQGVWSLPDLWMGKTNDGERIGLPLGFLSVMEGDSGAAEIRIKKDGEDSGSSRFWLTVSAGGRLFERSACFGDAKTTLDKPPVLVSDGMVERQAVWEP